MHSVDSAEPYLETLQGCCYKPQSVTNDYQSLLANGSVGILQVPCMHLVNLVLKIKKYSPVQSNMAPTLTTCLMPSMVAFMKDFSMSASFR